MFGRKRREIKELKAKLTATEEQLKTVQRAFVKYRAERGPFDPYDVGVSCYLAGEYIKKAYGYKPSTVITGPGALGLFQTLPSTFSGKKPERR